MQNIIIDAEDAWGYFQDHKLELKTAEHIIATNDSYGVEITITNENNLPCFITTADGYQYSEERAVSSKDCKDTVEMLYDYYLTGDFADDEKFGDSLLEQEDAISERELELDDAISMLLDTLIENDVSLVLGEKYDVICEDLKDRICEYLYRKHGVSIRRPMVLEDEDSGEEFFEEYPYNSMVFE